MKKLSAAEQRFKDYLVADNIQPFSAVTEEEIQHEAKLFREWAGDPTLPFEELHVKMQDGFHMRVIIFNPEARGQIYKASGDKNDAALICARLLAK